MLVVWCPDWPVVAACAAADVGIDVPAAVVAANRVLACNGPARAEGVAVGLRGREAQGRCPELVVLPDDPDRDARRFEPVAAAVEELAVGVEVVEPGVVAAPAKGPVGYFGSAEAAAERLIDHVAARADAECLVGAADGLFAATLAARRGLIVTDTPAFLAPLDIRELDAPDLVDLLRRLGIGTLGAFAALDAHDVATRFGAAAAHAHRLAAGREQRPLARRDPPVDLSVTAHPDPPVDRVDAAAFLARALAERLHAGLAAHGLACTRLAIHAATGTGAELARVWRCAEPLTPAGIADRLRWQLDGWLSGPRRPDGPITTLCLDPVEVVDGRALQLGMWQGAHAEHAERAARAMVHVQGLLGPNGVLVPVEAGGRGPADRVHLVPWGDDRTPPTPPDRPWPGALPAPSPTVVPRHRLPATLRDAEGAEVVVTGRFRLTADPAEVTVARHPARRVLTWAGPWPADERWWSPDGRRRARLQVVLAPESEEDNHPALLLTRENETWTVEGIYD
ncbi:DNA polymerase Y family protein [Actinokineospora guangxiensis]|uniref:DNA polymerase Y family protein n=1 Tax=Actinokineospora guangxiensis TaxID=1490288 RepID=A0ABW0EFJ4_9PSEU